VYWSKDYERIVKAVLISLCLLVCTLPACAQEDDPVLARLAAEKAETVEPGLYNAGDGHDFTLVPYRGKFLLRFAGSTENFVLTMDSVSLGGKLLKYDTGVTALRVPVWGGLTLYVSDAPNGLPATRQGDAALPPPTPVTAGALQAALADETNHFLYVDNVTLNFTADVASLANADARALAFDTLVNIQVGIERFLAGSAPARQALGKRIAAVKIQTASQSGVALSGRDLRVSFAPAEGLLGRASSHAVAHQLGKLLAVNTPE
jgi:hypothetical protein